MAVRQASTNASNSIHKFYFLIINEGINVSYWYNKVTSHARCLKLFLPIPVIPASKQPVEFSMIG
ncbi:hypothetical protein ABIC84_004862 [Mucilaginibacter sp. 3215]